MFLNRWVILSCVLAGVMEGCATTTQVAVPVEQNISISQDTMVQRQMINFDARKMAVLLRVSFAVEATGDERTNIVTIWGKGDAMAEALAMVEKFEGKTSQRASASFYVVLKYGRAAAVVEKLRAMKLAGAFGETGTNEARAAMMPLFQAAGEGGVNCEGDELDQELVMRRIGEVDVP